MKYVIALESECYGLHFLWRFVNALKGVQGVTVTGPTLDQWDMLTIDDLLESLRKESLNPSNHEIVELAEAIDPCRSSGNHHKLTKALEALFPNAGYALCSTMVCDALHRAQERT